MITKGVLIGGALSMLAVATAQDKVLKWYAAGDEVGQCVYRITDSAIESKSDLAIAGMKLSSTVSGKFSGGKITDYNLTLKQPGIDLLIDAKNGKAKITMNGKKEDADYKPAQAYFGNIHPGTIASVVRKYDKSTGGKQTIETLMLDGAVQVKFGVVIGTARKVKEEVVQAFKASIGGTEIDLFIGESGDVAAMSVPAQRLDAIAAGYESLLVDPATLFPELSQPTVKARTSKNVRTHMRDGVALSADIARPVDDGKYPAILVRTPYGREASMIDGAWYAKRGYVYVSQDVRGRGGSAGAWKPFFNERKDGYDTIAWIIKQPWSDGKVGMIGGSYLGWTQWWAAAEGHPALKCIIPQVSPPDPFYNMPWDHGIPMLFGAIWWGQIVSQKAMPRDPFGNMKNFKKFLTLPITKVDDAVLGKNIPFVDDWWMRETNSAFTTAGVWKDAAKIKIPALHISGWWDGDGIGTKLNYAMMRKLGRENQFLIYGPWTHLFNTTSKIGDVDYGAGAILELNSVYLRWFDRWLKDKPVLSKQPRVRVFVTGANEWRNLRDWPDPRSKEVTLYFSKGPANGGKSKGELSWIKPGSQKPDRYTYDPGKAKIDINELSMDPDSSNITVHLKASDRNALLYKTASLAQAVEMGGPIDIDLYFSTSAVDTDFFGSVVDVDPKGIMRLIGLPGKLRAKYRNGMDKPSLLKPGQVYKITLAHWDSAHRFKKGHRIG
ncbi:MAG: CocE/NonD family hydrolase, partial [Armatimonadetes bacterium]|nr:CocE/NonD family hydrolase [Armatimonadota bacterium]